LATTLQDLAFSEIRDMVHGPVSVFSPDDTVSKVLGVLERTARYEAAVSSASSVGLITIRDLLGVDQPARTKVDGVWRATGSASPGARVIDVAESLVRNNVRAVPVVEAGEVVGLLSQVDLIDAMAEVEELESVPAKELIRSPVWSLDINEGIAYARRIMLERGISHIPVIEYGRLVGMVTAETLVHSFITPASKATTGDRVGERAPRFPGQVSAVMDTHPCTVGPEASVLETLRGLRDTGKGACVMTSPTQTILGIVTPRELISLITRLRVEEELPVYIIGLSDEDFFERAVAEEKVRRVLQKGMKFRPDINEISIRIKSSKTRGSRTRYELTARALSPEGQINAEARGWDLIKVFDELCDTLGKAIRKSKPETPGRTRMRRSRR
jgi:CBS domain-containing protein/ribosome-associated translation inhibitor RaiA